MTWKDLGDRWQGNLGTSRTTNENHITGDRLTEPALNAELMADCGYLMLTRVFLIQGLYSRNYNEAIIACALLLPPLR